MDEQIAFRVDAEVKAEFVERCKNMKRDPSEMCREIIAAFNEDRLRIIRKTETMGKLYDN